MNWGWFRLAINLVALALFLWNSLHCGRTGIWEFICLPRGVAVKVTVALIVIMCGGTALVFAGVLSPEASSLLLNVAFGIYMGLSIYFRARKSKEAGLRQE